MFSVSSVVNYSYLTNSYLISTVSNLQTGIYTEKEYEPHRNLLTSVKNYAGNQLISGYTYNNDYKGLRIERKDERNSTIMTNSFSYNGRMELI